jgi:hypothetical protein
MKIIKHPVSSCRITEQNISVEEPLQRGIEEKSKEFWEGGAEVHADA